ncbi:hypothetical protein PLESTM_001936500 [Pleodorina starrii]|nr:hypothetical protein PLESTM_001936500 [Pleodorina starrii]
MAASEAPATAASSVAAAAAVPPPAAAATAPPAALTAVAALRRRYPRGPGNRADAVSAWAIPRAVGGSGTSGGSRTSGGAVVAGSSSHRVGLPSGAGAGDPRAASVVVAAARRRGGNGGGDAAVSMAEPVAERIEDTELYDETYKSYLTYAMSVIVSRAIPDVRDGLKPVHRRILYAMHELGLAHNKPFKKCARVVGEVLGKFHPHGDTAVYDSLVRMAQPFSMRAPLVDGHGNFGSLDDDPAAAMRYTECRLTRAASEALLRDLGPDTVDWQPTFDESQLEPLVLPAVVPNLLVNGSSGIAVGLASNIPPHNLGEVVSALRALIADPRVTTEQLMQHVRGPDFPTGGELVVGPELVQAYATGKGAVVVRGKARVQRLGGGGGGGHEGAAAGRGRRRTAAAAAAAATGDMEDGAASGGGGGREQIVITEMPYQVVKSDLVAAIAELIESKQLEGVSDVRDESDRTGVRVVVEVKKGHSGEAVLAQLYKSTKLQVNFNYNCMSLLRTRPRLMGLKEMLQAFLDFRCDVVQRRSSAALRSARQRLHLVEGFLRLLGEPGRLDGVVADVRGAADGAAARGALVARHGLSEEQAEAILGLTLRRLTGLEASKLEAERDELQKTISRLQDILADRTALLAVVEQEAAALAAAYPDPRRTTLVAAADVASAPSPEDLLPDRPCLLLASRRGFLRRLPDESLTAQNRNTRGKSGIRLRSGDALAGVAAASDRDTLLLISPDGRMFKTRAANVPSPSSSSSQSSAHGAAASSGASPSGASLANVLKIPQSFPVAALVPVPRGLMPPAAVRASRRGGAAGPADGAACGPADNGVGDVGSADVIPAEPAAEGVAEREPQAAAAVEAEGAGEEGAGEEGGEEVEETAVGPCLVLCSRRGMIKRLALRNRRDRAKGVPVMRLGSFGERDPKTRSADAAAGASTAAAAAGGGAAAAGAAASGGAARSDELGWAALSSSPDDVVVVVTAAGRALLFPASDLRVHGALSAGNMAIRTSARPHDHVAAMSVLPAELAPLLQGSEARAGASDGAGGGDDVDAVEGNAEEEEEEEVPEAEEVEGGSSSPSPSSQPEQQPEPPAEASRGGRPVGPCLLIVTVHGIGKRIPLGQMRLGRRRQSGVLAIRVATAERARKARGSGGGDGAGSAATARGPDRVVAALAVYDGQEVVMASRNGVVVRQSVDGITVQSRMTRGTFVMQLDDGDEVVDVVVAAAPAVIAGAAAAPVAGRIGGGENRGQGQPEAAAAAAVSAGGAA